VIILTILWLVLSVVFVLWGVYSLTITLDIPTWFNELPEPFRLQYTKILRPIIHFGYLISTVVWLVFSAVFVYFAHGTFKKDHKSWTAGLIVSTIFLAIFGLMLASFMINLLMFKDLFSISGTCTTIIAFLIDLGIIFFLTRPITKLYFELE